MSFTSLLCEQSIPPNFLESKHCRHRAVARSGLLKGYRRNGQMVHVFVARRVALVIRERAGGGPR